MTIPQIKVKIQRGPQVKLKMLPRFPADVTAASPIDLDRTGGNYAFSLDVDALRDSLDPLYISSDLQTVVLGFPSVAAVAATTSIDTSVNYIRVDSYTAGAGYGGGYYKRTVSTPSHSLYITAVDGSKWELLPTLGHVDPTQAGAIPDGVVATLAGTDNQTALENVLTYSRIKGVPIYFGKAGVYAHSDTWALGSHAGFIPDVDFIGPDMAVTLLHTGGAEPNVSLDAGATQDVNYFGGQFGKTGRPLLTGNTTTTDAFFLRGYHHSFIRYFAGDCATSGLHVTFSVCSTFDVVASKNDRPAATGIWVTTPTYGALFDVRQVGVEYSSDCELNLIIEGMTGGIYNDGMTQSRWYGTSEANTDYGYLGTVNAFRNKFVSFDNEANGNTDWSFAGECDSELDHCIGVTNTTASVNISGTSHRIKIVGGYYRNININASASHTVLDSVTYFGTFTDSGTGSTWKNLYDATGLAFATDRISAVGDTGTGALVHYNQPLIVKPTLQDSSDTTKQAIFSMSGISNATTRTYTLPDANMTLARIDAAQTFTGTQTFSSTISGSIDGNAATATTATTATNATNSAITNDTTTNATMYPVWVTADTGNLPLKVASTKVTFNPSTGALSATSFTGAGTGLTGTAASLTAGNVTTNANLTGEVTSVGNAATLTNSAVIGKVLTGYTSGAGTVAATDTIIQAIQKLNGNDATNANLTGPITSVGNATSVASQTGSGSTFVMNTSPTLVTPLLGTPTSGVLTNCTGTASGLTAGTVSTTAAFQATKSADQTGITDATATTITWDTEQYDIGSYFASNTWTPPAGYVHITLGAIYGGTITAGTLCLLDVYKNGSAYRRGYIYASTNAASGVVSFDDYANGTDAYTAVCYIDVSSGTGTVGSNSVGTYFSGFRFGV